MNKIKVIDLLNMISKGEKVPKKIKLKNFEEIYTLREDCTGYKWYGEEKTNNDFGETIHKNLEYILKQDIEILEEPKKINKIRIDYNSINIDKAFETGTTTFFREKDIEIFQCLSSKINELIDEINNLKEK